MCLVICNVRGIAFPHGLGFCFVKDLAVIVSEPLTNSSTSSLRVPRVLLLLVAWCHETYRTHALYVSRFSYVYCQQIRGGTAQRTLMLRFIRCFRRDFMHNICCTSPVTFTHMSVVGCGCHPGMKRVATFDWWMDKRSEDGLRELGHSDREATGHCGSAVFCGVFCSCNTSTLWHLSPFVFKTERLVLKRRFYARVCKIVVNSGMLGHVCRARTPYLL